MDEKTLQHVAATARLALTEEDKKEFLPQLKEIMDMFSKLEELETDCAPSFHPVKIRNALREDVPHESITQEEALKNTRSKDGFVLGPRVLR